MKVRAFAFVGAEAIWRHGAANVWIAAERGKTPLLAKAALCT
jgi:hypothetical protein